MATVIATIVHEMHKDGWLSGPQGCVDTLPVSARVLTFLPRLAVKARQLLGGISLDQAPGTVPPASGVLSLSVLPTRHPNSTKAPSAPPLLTSHPQHPPEPHPEHCSPPLPLPPVSTDQRASVRQQMPQLVSADHVSVSFSSCRL